MWEDVLTKTDHKLSELHYFTTQSGKILTVKTMAKPEKCVENRSIDKYCPACDDEGNCSPSLNWSNPTPIGSPLPKKEIYMIKGYKLASRPQITEMLNSGLHIVSFKELSPFTLDNRNTNYVSYSSQHSIPVTTATKAYVLRLSDGQGYAVLSVYDPITNSFHQ